MSSQEKDIRWQQRFNSFTKAFSQIEKYGARENLNELEKQGLIKSFEYTYELAWKTLQDLLKDKGYQGITGPRPVIQQSYQDGYLNGEAWARMHLSRNLTSHTYDPETADEIVDNIKKEYIALFRDLLIKLKKEES